MFRYLLLLIASTLPCLAGETLYRGPDGVPDASVLESDGTSMTIRFDLPVLTGSEATVPGGGTILRVPGWGELAATGCPDLPVLRRLVMVPDHGDVRLEIVEETTTTLGIFDIPPRQEPALRSGHVQAFARDESVYGTAGQFPAECAVLEGVQVLRDIRAARVRFQPVRYDPATGEVTLVTSATVRLTFEGVGENELDRTFEGTTPGFLPVYGEVLGYESRGPFLDGSYVFIGTSQSLSAIEALIDWKRERGYRVVTAEVPAIGATAAEIDAWIELSYDLWQYPPEWILIAGGEDMVPVPLYSGFASDNIYGVIGTSTSVPSIHVGRITGSLEDLEYQAWKVLQHEADPFEPGFSWFQKAVTIGSSDGLDPLHSWEHTQMFMEYGIAVDYYCESSQYGGTPPDAAAILANVNEGRTVVDYIGHGWEQGWGTSGISSSDVAALTNGRMLPWVNSIACSNAAFTGGYCFGEAWMTEGDIETPRGGLGFMGATTGSPFGPTDSLAEYTWKGYFELGMHHMGAAVDYGKLKVEEFYGGGGWENNMMHMVFGCPEVDIYSDTSPIALLEADHSQYVWSGPWPVYVTTDGTSPVEGALVGVVQGGTLLGAGYTDQNGYLGMDIPELPFGASVEAVLTVTAHNCRPYTTSLEPAPEGWEEGGGTALFLDPALPCPFSAQTAITFGLTGLSDCNLSIFDVSGRLVRTLVDGQLPGGGHMAVWDGRTGSGAPCPDGVYFIRLETAGGSLGGRVIRLGAE
jgi:hypothetical protein